MSPDERTRYLGVQAGRILAAARDRNPGVAADCLEKVGERYGHDGVFGVCCAMAAVVQRLAFPGTKRGDGTLDNEHLAIIQQLPGADPNPDALWAARFVTSYINGDRDTTAALFYGALDFPEEIVAGVVSLVSMAGDVARETEQEITE